MILMAYTCWKGHSTTRQVEDIQLEAKDIPCDHCGENAFWIDSMTIKKPKFIILDGGKKE